MQSSVPSSLGVLPRVRSAESQADADAKAPATRAAMTRRTSQHRPPSDGSSSCAAPQARSRTLDAIVSPQLGASRPAPAPQPGGGGELGTAASESLPHIALPANHSSPALSRVQFAPAAMHEPRCARKWLAYAVAQRAGAPGSHHAPKPCQDAFVVRPSLLPHHPDTHLFAVLDGHGAEGHNVARAAAAALPAAVLARLLLLDPLPDVFLRPWEPLPAPSLDRSLNVLKGVLRGAVAAVERAVLADPALNCAFSGTTLTCVLCVGAHLLVAAVGDSLCVVGGRAPARSPPRPRPRRELQHQHPGQPRPAASDHGGESDPTTPTPRARATLRWQGRAAGGAGASAAPAAAATTTTCPSGASRGGTDAEEEEAQVGGEEEDEEDEEEDVGLDVGGEVSGSDNEGASAEEEEEETEHEEEAGDDHGAGPDAEAAACSRAHAVWCHALSVAHTPALPCESERIASRGGVVATTQGARAMLAAARPCWAFLRPHAHQLGPGDDGSDPAPAPAPPCGGRGGEPASCGESLPRSRSSATDLGIARAPPLRVWDLRAGLRPGLAVSRSVGDLAATAVGVVCEPSFRYRFATAATDRWVVAASDGLWDVVSPLDAVRMCERAGGTAAAPASAAASSLVDRARARWAADAGAYVDDITAVVLRLW